MAEKLALGKGLSALLGDGFDLGGRKRFNIGSDADAALEKIYSIKLSDIQPDPNQPRHNMDGDALASLAESIKQHGILQPLLLRAVDDINNKKYQIIAGERRWRAAQLAGLTEAPCRVLTVSDNDVRELALIENIQRRDLTLIEIASALEAMIEKNGLTQEQCAARLGWSRPMVSNRLRLLTLPQEIIDMLVTDRLTEGHARTLLSAPEDQRIELALAAADGAMTVRQLESEIKRRNDPMLEDAEASAAEDVKNAEEAGSDSESSENNNDGEKVSKRFHAIRLPRPLKDFRKRGIKIRVGRRNGAARIVLDDLQGIEDETIIQALEKCLHELYPDPGTGTCASTGPALDTGTGSSVDASTDENFAPAFGDAHEFVTEEIAVASADVSVDENFAPNLGDVHEFVPEESADVSNVASTDENFAPTFGDAHEFVTEENADASNVASTDENFAPTFGDANGFVTEESADVSTGVSNDSGVDSSIGASIDSGVDENFAPNLGDVHEFVTEESTNASNGVSTGENFAPALGDVHEVVTEEDAGVSNGVSADENFAPALGDVLVTEESAGAGESHVTESDHE